jgi:hypothetical protein
MKGCIGQKTGQGEAGGGCGSPDCRIASAFLKNCKDIKIYIDFHGPLDVQYMTFLKLPHTEGGE